MNHISYFFLTLVKDHGTGSNGYSNGLKNGTTSHNNDIAHVDIMRGMRRTRKPSEKVRLLPSAAEDLKIKVYIGLHCKLKFIL